MKKHLISYAFFFALIVIAGATLFFLIQRTNSSGETLQHLQKPQSGDVYLMRDNAYKDYVYLLFQELNDHEYIFKPSTFAYATVLSAQHARKEGMIDFAHEVRFSLEDLTKLYRKKELIAIERNNQ
ncbi:hypothetical protein HY620_00365 [Candidatus Uhrbacteria bacterium]|nr:hypothetical protein [Candidatus Uhrbacteria bacterium]